MIDVGVGIIWLFACGPGVTNLPSARYLFISAVSS